MEKNGIVTVEVGADAKTALHMWGNRVRTWCRRMIPTILMMVGFTLCGMQGQAWSQNELPVLDEGRVNDRVEADFATLREKGRGEGVFLRGEVRRLTVWEAAMLAAESNLLVHLSSLQRKIAEQGIEEARAAFDPVLTVLLSADYNQRYNRKKIVDKWKKSSERIFSEQQGRFIEHGIKFDKDPVTVEYIEYTEERPAGYYPTSVTASEKPVTGADDRVNFAATVSQRLGWGAVLMAGLDVTYRDAKWINNPFDERRTAGSYGRPWTSGLTLQGSTPLPRTRGFGPLNPEMAGVSVARMDAEDTHLAMRAALNDVLLAVEFAYWDLVGASLRLDVARQVEGLSAELLGRYQRLYDQQLITSSDIGQVEVQHSRVKAAGERAVGDVALAVNALAQLLDLPPSDLLLPVGYAQLLEPTVPAVDLDRLEVDNPELARGILALQKAELLRDVAANQTLLPISVSAILRMYQNDAVFGHKTLDRSLTSRPDNLYYRVGVAYQDGFRGRGVKAALHEQEALTERQSLLTDQLRIDLRTAFEGARIDLDSAAARVAIAQNNEKTATAVYDRAVRLSQEELLARYQVVEALAGLLEVRNDSVLQKIAMKKAEARLLAVAGVLVTRYSGPVLAYVEVGETQGEAVTHRDDYAHMGER